MVQSEDNFYEIDLNDDIKVSQDDQDKLKGDATLLTKYVVLIWTLQLSLFAKDVRPAPDILHRVFLAHCSYRLGNTKRKVNKFIEFEPPIYLLKMRIEKSKRFLPTHLCQEICSVN